MSSSSSTPQATGLQMSDSIKSSTDRLLYRKNDIVSAKLSSDNGIYLSGQPLQHQPKHEESILDTLSACYKTPDTTESDFIPFKNILNVESIAGSVDEADEVGNSNLLEITYALPFLDLNHDLKIDKIKVDIESGPEIPPSLAQFILTESYGKSIIRPSILVLINPHGGQGHAKTIYKNKILPILQAARANITYFETKYHGHATEIARELDVNDYDIIVCCSGDGIPHEVINGFYLRPDKGLLAFNKIAVTQLPCGSGNALSLSTHGSKNASVATLYMLKAHKTKLDLMAITQGTGSEKITKLSFLSQCYGIIADSDIGTEHLRWLGPIRFELGVIQKVFSGAKYPCDLFVKYKYDNNSEILNHVNDYLSNNDTENELPIVTEENLQITSPDLDQPVPNDWRHIPQEISHNLNILYVGKMPFVSADTQFFPAALPNDGSMDMIVTDSNNSVWKLTSILLAVESGKHIDDEKVHHTKVLSYRLIPNIKDDSKHYISIDGEDFPFEPFQVEILPGVLTGLLQDGNFVETSFTK